MKHGLEIQYVGITEQEFRNRPDSGLTVISGTNNSGKSLVLKELFTHFGEKAYLCGTNRYYSIQHFQTYQEQPRYVSTTWDSVKKQIADKNNNNDPVVMSFRDVFVRMSDTERGRVYQICSECLGERVELCFQQPGNSMSKSFLTIGGKPLSQCSSGSRMLVHLLSVLVSKRFQYVLIDEPELGLTPRIQNKIQELICDQTVTYFEHLKHIFIATHSHIFLNRRRLADNFLIERSGTTVSVKQLSNFDEFRDLQFSQLGNSFEQLQLPSGFVIVEGKTDYQYFDRLIRLRIPGNRVNVINANGDGQVKKKLHDLLEVIGDLSTSPYNRRVLVILDATHSPSLSSDLQKKGLPKMDVVIWDKNGIEYYYPDSLLQTIYNDDTLTASDLQIENDLISHNGIEKKKAELCDEITKSMNGTEPLHPDLEQVLNRIESFA